ncbi:transposable element Tc3 transposase [Trichonephila clavipes]|nr:transposable element Tc3 transposase [Trichonephila clavipes]
MANNQSVRHLDAFTRDRIIGKLEEGRSVTIVAAEFGIAHSIVSRLWRQFQTTGTAIRGFSSGRPRGNTPADHRYIVLQAKKEKCGRQREKSLDTRHGGLWVCSSLFMDDNAPCHRTVAAEQLLESRRLAARILPPVTIRELRLALQDEWAAMPQQLIDTLILSMGRRCETCLAAGSDVVQSGRRIFDDFFQHLWPYIGNNTANVVLQMVKRLWLIRKDQ